MKKTNLKEFKIEVLTKTQDLRPAIEAKSVLEALNIAQDLYPNCVSVRLLYEVK